ncbi:putative oligomerization/nucleic acid binding protein [Hoeflea marina]|uniref:Putative oligomerization/nucleic acid binding protein n=1 Tax=Hoeflea marina TaxID=274592 RepID=A0A317PSF7_9HYPH|nr:SHOCT domain-containing protein [Hoeflea marina]PWW03665.1 putative oligomerization/nucleic acid binding protein [Hoeflea marina]
MTELSQDGRRAVDEIARRHGVSPAAVEHVLMALTAGQGNQAQFNHPDLGGMGQWSRGGMTMVGDMFNNELKAKVDAICSDVARLLREHAGLRTPAAVSSQTQGGAHAASPSAGFQSQSQGHRTGGGHSGESLFVEGGSSGQWWPETLGRAASTGAQNRMRYAWFPDSRRMAIDTGDGVVRVYDTGEHHIGGFSQQQGGDQSLSFTSQHGPVRVSELRQVDGGAKAGRNDGAGNQNPLPSPPGPDAGLTAASVPENTAEAERQDDSASAVDATHGTPKPSGPAEVTAEEVDVFARIERLAGLHAKGILSDEEYRAKKAELLARI